MTEARLASPLKDGLVQCRLCSHFCLIKPGSRGICGVRENRDGTLYALDYSKVAAHSLDPVEKKPLYHFQPGSLTFSFATMGCNLQCSFCQNWSLSQPPREGGDLRGEDIVPASLVNRALRSGAASMAYTYSEPTVFYELMQDTARLAKAHGLKNIMVTNGYMSRPCLEELKPLISAANVDLKSFSEVFYRDTCGGRLKPVLDNLRTIRHGLGWWLEVTTLLIPGQNDSEDELDGLTRFLADEIGPDTPWHISRFHPDYLMNGTGPTSSDTLQRAYGIGKANGLRFVYIGNMPGLNRQDTFCPACDAELINRSGFSAHAPGISSGRCISCGENIPGVDLG